MKKTIKLESDLILSFQAGKELTILVHEGTGYVKSNIFDSSESSSDPVAPPSKEQPTAKKEQPPKKEEPVVSSTKKELVSLEELQELTLDEVKAYAKEQGIDIVKLGKEKKVERWKVKTLALAIIEALNSENAGEDLEDATDADEEEADEDSDDEASEEEADDEDSEEEDEDIDVAEEALLILKGYPKKYKTVKAMVAAFKETVVEDKETLETIAELLQEWIDDDGDNEETANAIASLFQEEDDEESSIETPDGYENPNEVTPENLDSLYEDGSITIGAQVAVYWEDLEDWNIGKVTALALKKGKVPTKVTITYEDKTAFQLDSENHSYIAFKVKAKKK